MAAELGSISEIEGWTAQRQRPLASRMIRGLWSFARKKPLGAACGFIVIFFMVIGDVVPEGINKISRTAGLGDHPVPYLADQIDGAVGFVYPYAEQDLRARVQGASGEHLLGTDGVGRDIFSRLLYGARAAVVVSFGAVLIQQVLASVIGIVSGYYGGWLDKLLFRLVDAFQALPTLIVLIAVLGIFGSGLWQLVIVLGVLHGPTASRILRGQTFYIMSSPYIEAARVVGCGDSRIMMRYVLPNVAALIILVGTISLGIMVLLEATLSFLGYGLPPPFPSWGQMLSLDGREYMRDQPGLAIYPGVAIGILVFSFNLLGDALRDVLDPRLRGSR